MFGKLLTLIKDSTKNTTKGVKSSYSHTKISSYFILGSILSSTVAYLVIDIVNAFISWLNGNPYVIPIEHISILALIMSHHLVLLRLKNASEKTKIMNDKFTFGQDSGGAPSETTDDENEQTEE